MRSRIVSKFEDRANSRYKPSTGCDDRTSVFILRLNFKFQARLFLGFRGHETNEAIRQAAQRANWIVDVGAGSGELCVLSANLNKVRRIIAIEPDQAMLKSLQANIDHNEILYNDILSGRIEIVEKFIGTQNGDEYVTLDQLNIDRSLHGFIKIDVDGSECDILRSGQQLLSYFNVDILVGTHSSELERNCVHFLEDVGYTCRIVKKTWWRSLIPEQRPCQRSRWLFATPCNRQSVS
jgi:Methyltransferase FkbM domain